MKCVSILVFLLLACHVLAYVGFAQEQIVAIRNQDTSFLWEGRIPDPVLKVDLSSNVSSYTFQYTDENGAFVSDRIFDDNTGFLKPKYAFTITQYNHFLNVSVGNTSYIVYVPFAVNSTLSASDINDLNSNRQGNCEIDKNYASTRYNVYSDFQDAFKKCGYATLVPTFASSSNFAGFPLITGGINDYAFKVGINVYYRAADYSQNTFIGSTTVRFVSAWVNSAVTNVNRPTKDTWITGLFYTTSLRILITNSTTQPPSFTYTTGVLSDFNAITALTFDFGNSVNVYPRLTTPIITISDVAQAIKSISILGGSFKITLPTDERAELASFITMQQVTRTIAFEFGGTNIDFYRGDHIFGNQPFYLMLPTNMAWGTTYMHDSIFTEYGSTITPLSPNFMLGVNSTTVLSNVFNYPKYTLYMKSNGDLIVRDNLFNSASAPLSVITSLSSLELNGRPNYFYMRDNHVNVIASSTGITYMCYSILFDVTTFVNNILSNDCMSLLNNGAVRTGIGYASDVECTVSATAPYYILYLQNIQNTVTSTYSTMCYNGLDFEACRQSCNLNPNPPPFCVIDSFANYQLYGSDYMYQYFDKIDNLASYCQDVRFDTDVTVSSSITVSSDSGIVNWYSELPTPPLITAVYTISFNVDTINMNNIGWGYAPGSVSKPFDFSSTSQRQLSISNCLFENFETDVIDIEMACNETMTLNAITGGGWDYSCRFIITNSVFRDTTRNLIRVTDNGSGHLLNITITNNILQNIQGDFVQVVNSNYYTTISGNTCSGICNSYTTSVYSTGSFITIDVLSSLSNTNNIPIYDSIVVEDNWFINSSPVEDRSNPSSNPSNAISYTYTALKITGPLTSTIKFMSIRRNRFIQYPSSIRLPGFTSPDMLLYTYPVGSRSQTFDSTANSNTLMRELMLYNPGSESSLVDIWIVSDTQQLYYLTRTDVQCKRYCLSTNSNDLYCIVDNTVPYPGTSPYTFPDIDTGYQLCPFVIGDTVKLMINTVTSVSSPVSIILTGNPRPTIVKSLQIVSSSTATPIYIDKIVTLAFLDKLSITSGQLYITQSLSALSVFEIRQSTVQQMPPTLFDNVASLGIYSSTINSALVIPATSTAPNSITITSSTINGRFNMRANGISITQTTAIGSSSGSTWGEENSCFYIDSVVTGASLSQNTFTCSNPNGAAVSVHGPSPSMSNNRASGSLYGLFIDASAYMSSVSNVSIMAYTLATTNSISGTSSDYRIKYYQDKYYTCSGSCSNGDNSIWKSKWFYTGLGIAGVIAILWILITKDPLASLFRTKEEMISLEVEQMYLRSTRKKQ